MKYLNKFFYVLPSKAVILLPWFFVFVLVSILEVIGIGIVGPFITLASNPLIIFQNGFLSFLYQQLGFTEEAKFIALIGLIIVIVFCIKSAISWYAQARIFRFSYVQKEKLIQRLMNAYLEAPYTYYISKNSAEIINNTVTQTYNYANSILSTFLVSSSNFVAVLALSILLCIVNPLAVVSLLCTLTPLILLFSLFKDKLRLWGKELSDSNQEIIRNINHGLGGFKEVRIIGCGKYFEEKTTEQARRYANASIAFYAFKLFPRYLIETLLVVFLVGFISISLLLKQDTRDLTATLGVFALASIRLIPAFSNLMNGISVLRNSSYSLTLLYNDLKDLETIEKQSNLQKIDINYDSNFVFNHNVNQKRKLQFHKRIVLDQVTYRYPNTRNESLRGISLSLEKGKSIALIGKSGAGKTTLVDVVLGLLTPQTGDIKVDDISIYEDLRGWQNLIGYIPQAISIIDDTVERNIAFGIPDELINPDRLYKAIHAAQLDDVIANLPDGIKTRVGERGVMLSGGQRQRVGIARALYHEREILVLDEATSALDNETESLVTEAIKSLSGMKTMIIIAHRLTTVEHCDQVYVLEQGQITRSGKFHEVLENEHALNEGNIQLSEEIAK